MKKNPLIELTVDEMMDELRPTECSPYVWIVRIHDRSGCAVDTDFYPPAEAREKLSEFLEEVGSVFFRSIFEATSCRLHGIEGSQAIDAITMGFVKYFEEEDCIADTSWYHADTDVDFVITTAWDGDIDRFTLLANGDILYPEDSASSDQ